MDEQENTGAVKPPAKTRGSGPSIGVMVFCAVVLSGAIYWAFTSGYIGPAKEGRDAIARKDYDAALKTLQPAADNGNGEAQRLLGDMYLEGLGVAQDDDTAMSWYRKAAEQGNMQGLMFAGAKDPALMLKHWSPMAAEFDKEVTYATEGAHGSERKLATMFDTGDGVEQDELKAYFWMARSVSYDTMNREGRGDNDAKLDAIAAKLTPEQLKTAKRITANWTSYAVPRSYQYHGKGPQRFDLDKQLAAALEGRDEAQFELGYRSETGDGMKKDLREAYFWYSFANAKHSDHFEQRRIGPYLRAAYLSTLLTPGQMALEEQRADEWKAAHPNKR